jgi:hypothetical protein
LGWLGAGRCYELANPKRKVLPLELAWTIVYMGISAYLDETAAPRAGWEDVRRGAIGRLDLALAAQS